MSTAESDAPSSYPYIWRHTSQLSIDDFLAKYKPSLVQNDGTKPWIYVKPEKGSSGEGQGNEGATLEEAAAALMEATEAVQAIQNDDSIPIRSNKKTGAKSKKELREQKQEEAAAKLKQISLKYRYTCGKWLNFASSDRIDLIWSSISRSLVSGSLASTAALSAKVSTSPQNETLNYQHVMCLYMPNVYHKDAVAEVMRVLLREHGVNLSGVKSDLYTLIGVDSKHPSGIRSTIWKNNELIKDSEIKELKDIFFAQKAKSNAVPDAEKKAGDPGNAKKSKLVAKKKPANDNPFESDDEDRNAEDEKTEKETKSKVTKRTKADDDEADNIEGPETKKRKVQ